MNDEDKKDNDEDVAAVFKIIGFLFVLFMIGKLIYKFITW